jgi:molybdate transport system ATP-binding protein
VTLLGIGPLIDRSPDGLSGGERQRVAVGRALLSQPKLLLMDEPLSALDQITKGEILPYLERLQQSLSIPVLYVSHDVAEVQRLADHVVLLDAGKVVSSATLEDALSDPRLPLARGATAATVLRACVASFDGTDGLTTLEIAGGLLLIPGSVGEPGSPHRLRIAAGDVSLALDPPSRSTILNVLAASIREIEPLEEGRVNVLLTLGEDGRGARLLARITQRSLRVLKLEVGQSLFAQVKAVSILDDRRILAPARLSSGGGPS